MTAIKVKLTDLLRQAAEKLEQMDIGSAISLYGQAAELAPDNAGVLMGLAMAHNRSGQAIAALQILERLWKSASLAKGKNAGVFKAAVLAQLGMAKQQMGQLKGALLAYEQAHKLMPNNALQQRIAAIKPLAASPEPVQHLVMSARQQAAAGQPDAAAKLYNAALQLHADSVEALHGLAMLHRQRGMPDTALPLLQKAIMLAPDRADFYNDLGMVFQDRGDYSKAVSFHKRALKIDSKFVFSLINLGVAYKKQELNALAISAYEEALKIAPDMAEIHNNLGNLYRIECRFEHAKHHLQRAIAIKPGYADAVENLKMVDLAAPVDKRNRSQQKKVASKKSDSEEKKSQIPATRAKTKPLPTIPDAEGKSKSNTDASGKSTLVKRTAAKKVPAPAQAVADEGKKSPTRTRRRASPAETLKKADDKT